jgi:hypothetical protein
MKIRGYLASRFDAPDFCSDLYRREAEKETAKMSYQYGNYEQKP